MAPRPKNPPPDRRQEILDAALHIFAEKGYSATTNADIARAAGVTPAALYYYFASKEELFRAVVTQRRAHLEPTVASFGLEEILAIPPRELFTAMLHGMVTFFSEERTQAILKIVMAEAPRDPSIMEIWQEQVISIVSLIIPYLEHQMEQGIIKRMDPRLFFLALMGPLMATVITRDLLQLPMIQGVSNEEMVRTVIETTLEGFLIERS